MFGWTTVKGTLLTPNIRTEIQLIIQDYYYNTDKWYKDESGYFDSRFIYYKRGNEITIRVHDNSSYSHIGPITIDIINPTGPLHFTEDEKDAWFDMIRKKNEEECKLKLSQQLKDIRCIFGHP